MGSTYKRQLNSLVTMSFLWLEDQKHKHSKTAYKYSFSHQPWRFSYLRALNEWFVGSALSGERDVGILKVHGSSNDEDNTKDIETRRANRRLFCLICRFNS